MAATRIRIRKNDNVVVIGGRDRGKRGRVLSVLPAKGRVVVEGINFVKRHTRPNPQKNVQGGVLEKEAPIRLCNLKVVCPESGKPTRIGRKRLEDGSGARVAKVSGATLS
jgi:large subunit ribosomal protein L24